MSGALRELLGLDEMVELAAMAAYDVWGDDSGLWPYAGPTTRAHWLKIAAGTLDACGVPALLEDAERSHIMALDMATKASTAEVALLAKSDAYDALVARGNVLIGQWRESAADYPEAMLDCADELERLLLVREGGDHA